MAEGFVGLSSMAVNSAPRLASLIEINGKKKCSLYVWDEQYEKEKQ